MFYFAITLTCVCTNIVRYNVSFQKLLLFLHKRKFKEELHISKCNVYLTLFVQKFTATKDIFSLKMWLMGSHDMHAFKVWQDSYIAFNAIRSVELAPIFIYRISVT